MARAQTIAELNMLKGEVTDIFRQTIAAFPAADPQQMAIDRRISGSLTDRCIEGAAVQAYRDHSISIAPGTKIEYVVTDARVRSTGVVRKII